MSDSHPITASRVRELLDYDPETGIFTWKVNRGHARVGSVAGCNKGGDYIRICIDNHRCKAHRLVFFWVLGRWPEQEVDHVDHDKTNNSWANLRDGIDDTTQNQNCPKRRDNSSGYTGVYWVKRRKKWQASIQVHGKLLHLGCFADIEDAIAARKAANLKYSFHPNHGKDLV